MFNRIAKRKQYDLLSVCKIQLLVSTDMDGVKPFEPWQVLGGSTRVRLREVAAYDEVSFRRYNNVLSLPIAGTCCLYTGEVGPWLLGLLPWLELSQRQSFIAGWLRARYCARVSAVTENS
ncbi:hypothetical protein AVEN_72216-1 [Araneus ventricosus]|uniref:Uncharacterized protein n=1 Tax=Araneus ventricosus TaxID=182803 RepID=A0A4Y2HER1_ARAVE|nr:hypothetical protein AVEN_72216-1 [Araneus ventricosus]